MNTQHKSDKVHVPPGYELNPDGTMLKLEKTLLELKKAESFAELWYFVMDEAPTAFEKIVSEYPPHLWMIKAYAHMLKIHGGR